MSTAYGVFDDPAEAVYNIEAVFCAHAAPNFDAVAPPPCISSPLAEDGEDDDYDPFLVDPFHGNAPCDSPLNGLKDALSGFLGSLSFFGAG